ncbi:MAG: hypothetical protein IPN24_16125, partial [Betaproteobacteria bacterium]|nr:hypothetical protein [Betaproteobacteria bacterium]
REVELVEIDRSLRARRYGVCPPWLVRRRGRPHRSRLVGLVEMEVEVETSFRRVDLPLHV